MYELIIVLFFLSLDATIPTERVESAVSSCHVYTNDDLDPLVCLAISYHESRFNSELQGRTLPSGSKARGMMQVIPNYITTHEPVDITTSSGSVIYGSSAFTYWLKKKHTIKKALCHYAAGNRCNMEYSRRVLSMAHELIFATHLR